MEQFIFIMLYFMFFHYSIIFYLEMLGCYSKWGCFGYYGGTLVGGMKDTCWLSQLIILFAVHIYCALLLRPEHVFHIIMQAGSIIFFFPWDFNLKRLFLLAIFLFAFEQFPSRNKWVFRLKKGKFIHILNCLRCFMCSGIYDAFRI